MIVVILSTFIPTSNATPSIELLIIAPQDFVEEVTSLERVQSARCGSIQDSVFFRVHGYGFDNDCTAGLPILCSLYARDIWEPEEDIYWGSEHKWLGDEQHNRGF